MGASEVPQDQVSDLEFYRMVRAQIEFESGLISQRLNWVMASQSFLFTAYAITLNGLAAPASGAIMRQQGLVNRSLPVVGMASCVLIYISVVAAVIAQGKLRRFMRERVPAERMAVFPAIQGARETRVMGVIAPLGLPLVFLVVWAVLMVRGMG